MNDTCIVPEHKALPPFCSPHNCKHQTFTQLTRCDHKQIQSMFMTTSNLPTSQPQNPAIAISTYRTDTKSAPQKQHPCHLPATNPQVQAEPAHEAAQGKSTHSTIPHNPSASPTRLAKLQNHPSVRDNHYVEQKTPRHCRQMLLHTCTPPPLLTPLSTS